MSITELTLIMFVALLLFGPEDLPVIARTLGKIVFQVRKFTNEIGKEFQAALDTPNKLVNEALKDSGTKAKPVTEKQEDSGELLTYEENEKEIDPEALTAEKNPLADLPTEVVSYPKEPQAGE